MALLIVEGLGDLFTGQVFLGRALDPMGFESVEDWTVWMVQAYFLVVVLMELSERARTLPRFRFHPATLFILSFLTLILAGTGLLMLPEMTTDGLGMNLSDALFTSTSATCVTGLMVQDAETFFTHKGHVVLMVLIKLGGLNIIAFGSLLALLARFGVGVRQHDVIEDFVNRGSILGSRGMLGRVILWSIGIEVIGAIGLFLFWPGGLFETTGDRIFQSLFCPSAHSTTPESASSAVDWPIRGSRKPGWCIGWSPCWSSSERWAWWPFSTCSPENPCGSA